MLWRIKTQLFKVMKKEVMNETKETQNHCELQIFKAETEGGTNLVVEQLENLPSYLLSPTLFEHTLQLTTAMEKMKSHQFMFAGQKKSKWQE